MIPRGDLIPAGPQLFPGLGVQSVQDRVGRCGDAPLGCVVEADVRIGLFGILAAAVREHDSVGDHRRLRPVHVSRDPGRRQLQLAVLLFHFERRDGAILHFAVLHGGLEGRMFRSPE